MRKGAWAFGGRAVLEGLEVLKGGPGIVIGEEGFLHGTPLATGALRIFHLNLGGVHQDDLGQEARRLKRVDRPLIPTFHEQGQSPDMVEMGMGEEHRVQRRDLKPKGLGVQVVERLGALELAAVNEHLARPRIQQVARARNRHGRAVGLHREFAHVGEPTRMGGGSRVAV